MSRAVASARRTLLAAVGALLAVALAASEEPSYWTRLDVPVLEDGLGYPRAVTADLHTGEVFVCDTRRNRIVIFDRDGLFSYQIAGGDRFSAPLDLAIDPEGYLLVLANHQRRRALVELDFDGLFLREVPLLGLPEESVEPSLWSVAMSHDGRRLYLLDTANLKVWILDRDGAIEAAVDLGAGLSEDETSDLVLGKVDVYGERLLVAVPMLGEIWLYDLGGDPVGRTGDKGTGPCKLGFPAAAAMDAHGDLLVVDQQRMYVMRWRPGSDRCLAEYYGPGTKPGYFYAPFDLSLDDAGRLYVSQGFDGRVQAYEGLAPALRPAADERESDAAPEEAQPPR